MVAGFLCCTEGSAAYGYDTVAVDLTFFSMQFCIRVVEKLAIILAPIPQWTANGNTIFSHNLDSLLILCFCHTRNNLSG